MSASLIGTWEFREQYARVRASWGLMEMLRIVKVWQEFPQQWARYRSRLCYQRCMPLALGDAE
jgi:hypothetical protein